jgi:beta-glucosidase
MGEMIPLPLRRINLKDRADISSDTNRAVISDWTALTKETGVTSVAAGCDLEMPGKENICRGTRLADALLQGEISRADVEKAVFNLLKLIDRTKGLNDTEEPAERSDDNMTVSENIRQAGREGIVLLKNSNDILPLSRVGMQIAVIGPNANRCVANGGGSAKVNPYHLVSPLSAIRNATKSAMTTLVTYAQGCDSSKWLPLASEYCKNTLGRPGVTIEYFKGDNFADDPVCIEHKSTTGLYLWDSAPEIVLPDYSFRVMAELRPKTTGFHTFSLSSVGPGRMYLDGVLFINNWDWTEEGEAMFGNSSEVLNTIYLPAEVPVQLLVESTSETRPCCKVSTEGTHGYGGVRIGYKEEVKKDLLAEAVTSARNANVAIVIVGLDNEWESEGYDRQTMDLPNNGSQDELIEAIVKVQPSTIVVNQSGSPVSMP